MSDKRSGKKKKQNQNQPVLTAEPTISIPQSPIRVVTVPKHTNTPAKK